MIKKTTAYSYQILPI